MLEAVAAEVETRLAVILAPAVLEVGEMVTVQLAQPIPVVAVVVIRVAQARRVVQAVLESLLLDINLLHKKLQVEQ